MMVQPDRTRNSQVIAPKSPEPNTISGVCESRDWISSGEHPGVYPGLAARRPQ